ncbi:hypothetical protein [Symbiopectobacterium sp. RP]|uniref:hypothetical protein n=1 Tax=Symbiopectobacterium sp. RP TaxID=3248553 RepID=UPI003D2DD135
MGIIVNRLKNDYSQCPDMWQKIQLIVIKIMSLGYNKKSVLNSKARLLNKYGVHDKNSLLLIASILFKRKIIKLGESSENAP